MQAGAGQDLPAAWTCSLLPRVILLAQHGVQTGPHRLWARWLFFFNCLGCVAPLHRVLEIGEGGARTEALGISQTNGLGGSRPT